MTGDIGIERLIVASQGPAIEQYPLFPLRAREEYAKSKGSADCIGEVEAYDGHRYYVKCDCRGRPTRASEWVCKQLSEVVGIAAPPAAVIELRNGELVFGSRRIAGVADDIVTQNYLISKTNINNAASQLCTILSSIYAFDLFVNNDDRHFGNYLTVEDNGVRRPYAFDYSRALFWRWPWVGFPLPDQNTRTCGKVLRSAHGFDLQAAKAVLKKLNSLEPTVFTRPNARRLAAAAATGRIYPHMVRSGAAARIDAIYKGLDDGSLL